ncbi:11684_t:CDS:2 [Entrophospora sp. SA101]|nr:11684_t:CDS:2 [Entrophospora sp. SA101]
MFWHQPGEESEINLIFSQEDNESLITTPTTITTTSTATTSTVTTSTTNTIEENESNSSNTSRETSWVWDFFSIEYNDNQEFITYICNVKIGIIFFYFKREL